MRPKKKSNYKNKNITPSRNHVKDEDIKDQKLHYKSEKLTEENVLKVNKPKSDETVLNTNKDDKSESTASTSDYKYGKRPVISNWKRYEIEDEIEEEETTNFANVLKNKYLGGAEFRFSDEREWEENCEAEADSLNNFFSIDLRDLSASLLCLPLYRRLDINQSYFEGEMISHMENEAQNQLDCYNKSKNKLVINNKYLLKLSEEEIVMPQVPGAANKNISILQLVESKLPSVTVQDLPAEAISELEFELDNLLNFDASTQNLEIEGDFPIVCFDD